MTGVSKIPVTIITGFLGAGKTTFINNLLQKYSKLQFALVENEFGDVAIDTKLIKGIDASQMFELKQGCICCTLTDEYELILQELAERFPNIDHLLIETTGIADPTSVINPFFRDNNLKEIYQFNGTIGLVDALNFEVDIEREITMKQMVISDLVLVNKSESLDENSKVDFKQKIWKINPLAEILFTEYGNSDKLSLKSIARKKHLEFDFAHQPLTHIHIQTRTLRLKQSVNKNDFIRWLEYTLDINKKNIYRVKGILFFENEPYEYILQGVGGSFEIKEEDLMVQDYTTEIVFIGNLEGIDLEYQLS